MSPRRPATREQLTRERILAGAVALADEHGLDGVSMRRVGDALGFEAMSLYRHVRDKDDLLDGMVETIVARFPVIDETLDWRESLSDLVRGAHRVLLAHPWVAALATSRPAVGPARLRFVDTVLGLLLAGGCSPQLAHDAMHAVEVHVFAFTLQELRLNDDASAHGYQLDVVRDDSTRYPHLAVTLATATHDHAAEFEFVFELLIAGIERALAASASD